MSSELIWFHHLHKCAGTLAVRTARVAGLRLHPGEFNGNPHERGKLIPLHQLAAAELSSFVDDCLSKGIQLIATEFGAPDFDVLREHPNVRTVTVLRQPLARFRSSYLFCVNCGFTDCLTIRDFGASSEHDARPNYYVRTFSRSNDVDEAAEIKANAVLEGFDHVLIQEQKDLAQQMAKVLGAPAAVPDRVNAGRGRNWGMLLGRARRGEFQLFWAGLFASRRCDPQFECEFQVANQPDYRLYEHARKLAPDAA